MKTRKRGKERELEAKEGKKDGRGRGSERLLEEAIVRIEELLNALREELLFETSLIDTFFSDELYHKRLLQMVRRHLPK